MPLKPKQTQTKNIMLKPFKGSRGEILFKDSNGNVCPEHHFSKSPKTRLFRGPTRPQQKKRKKLSAYLRTQRRMAA